MATCLRYEDVYGSVSTNVPAWNGSAVSTDALAADGYFKFQVSRASVGVALGLVPNQDVVTTALLTHGLRFVRGTVQVIESGIERTAFVPYTDEHRFYILRRAGEVMYCRSPVTQGGHSLPGDVFYTSTVLSSGAAYLGASLFSEGDTVLEAELVGDLASGGSGSALGYFSASGLASNVLVVVIVVVPITPPDGSDVDAAREIDLTDLPTTPGTEVTIVIGDDEFTYEIQPGDTAEDIADAIADLIDAHPDYDAHNDGSTIIIDSGGGTADIDVTTDADGYSDSRGGFAFIGSSTARSTVSVAGDFAFSGSAGHADYIESRGYFSGSGSSEGRRVDYAGGNFGFRGICAENPYNEALGTFTLGGSAAAGLNLSITLASGFFAFDGTTQLSEIVPRGADGAFYFAGRAVSGDVDADREIDLTDLPTTPGTEVTIVIGDDEFTYEIQPGDTAEDIANAIADLIDAHPDYEAHNDGSTIIITGGAGTADIGVTADNVLVVVPITAPSYENISASGTFGFFGYSAGRRIDLPNYFNVVLALADAPETNVNFCTGTFSADGYVGFDSYYVFEFDDAVELSSAVSTQPIYSLRDRWAIDDNLDSHLSVGVLFSDTAKLIDRYRAIWALVLATEIDLTADMTNAIAAVITGAEILVSLEALSTGFTTSTTFDEASALDSTSATRARIVAGASVNASMADTTQMPAMQLIGGIESSHWADTVLGPVTISTTFDEAPAFQGEVNARARIRAAQPDVGVALTDVAQTVGRPLIGGTERFVSTDIAAVVADFRLALLEGLIASDVFHRVAELSESELVDIATALSNAARAELAATETVALTDALQHSAVFLMSDSAALADSAGLTFSTLLDMADGSAFIVNLPLAEGDFSAWVLNADTTGVTTYSNFPMLGLASFEGVPYGLTETGLYRLEGDDDAGTDIDASLATGEMDFGTSRDKNVPRAYLYITQPGDVILKTISQIRGVRRETYYELAARTTEGDDETLRRVPLGRGVRGVWWRFELHNVDGSDFELDGAEVRPVVLSRRG